MLIRLSLFTLFAAITVFSQVPAIEPGVSQELAKWRAAHYSDVRYKLNLTLEKMSPVLKGTMEIRVNVTATAAQVSEPGAIATGSNVVSNQTPIVLDWRKITGHENASTISNVVVNGVRPEFVGWNANIIETPAASYTEHTDHLIIWSPIRIGENVIKLDFTSPILTSGSAITRYVDNEDGAEYIYSLFVPSDASTAFPVFDQPDLKARFSLQLTTMLGSKWTVVSNTKCESYMLEASRIVNNFCEETQPISTYVFAFAAGPWEIFADSYNESLGQLLSHDSSAEKVGQMMGNDTHKVYVRKSQAAKFKHHAAEVSRLNREGIKFLESYFDYKFPFPKYDIVLIPEFPFGGMEHAGATFLREASVIFPQEPTKNDYISRANVIFHEAAHQWFGDTVTMKWFDDLWLKEGFAEFMAYKTLEKVQGGNPTGREGAPSVKDAGQMPEVNAWKVFYERNKQAAYLTDSTKGTTPIYQEIANLNSAKSAYGNIVYRKAPSFLKQAEFYLGPEKFQTAVRSFLKKHEYANAGWEDLVKEFEAASGQDLKEWADVWVKQPGLPIFRVSSRENGYTSNLNEPSDIKTIFDLDQVNRSAGIEWREKLNILTRGKDRKNSTTEDSTELVNFYRSYPIFASFTRLPKHPVDEKPLPEFVFPNYQDYGYGIFLLDDKSRDYLLKNIQNEKDPFLRSMMWGSLWDSVREGELDPKEYVELVVKNLGGDVAQARASGAPVAASASGEELRAKANRGPTESDESTIAMLLARVSTAMNYYLPAPNIALANARASATDDLQKRVEDVLIERIKNAPTAGQRITFYRAFLNIAATERARSVLRDILNGDLGIGGGNTKMRPGTTSVGGKLVRAANPAIELRTKDRFDIVTKLLILGDAEAPKLLDDLIKTETSDEAKRYAYAAKAGIATAENKAKYWADFNANKEIPESWIEAAFGPFNSVRHSELTLPYLERALKELPNHKRNRKIFFVNGWLGSFIGGQRSEEALSIVNKFLADNPTLDKDLRLKILENVDLIERAVKIRAKYKNN